MTRCFLGLFLLLKDQHPYFRNFRHEQGCGRAGIVPMNACGDADYEIDEAGSLRF